MVLVGIGRDDTAEDVAFIAKKILTMRLFEATDDSTKMWKSNVSDINGDVLCVSQFTLMANTSKGNKPDFHLAMSTEQSKEMYRTLLLKLSDMYKTEKIKDGRFGAMMDVTLTNEGPVTLTIDSKKDTTV
ncbi:D-tyrosyl-tRNA(Tyr) deacylase [Pleurotus pulmonarius]|nr:D-tyrosyl-tRNA(Tyr) deacylase [Pleurotus pulmonarius]KAF4579227.1 D-tyrosyl-tRNA(Tyr) deacylase [Pleurotus pulmonarius]KAF4603435.1 D-tyrosyl-tRNA(Tyr) deacylase [Pleurotus pulmonarius]KAF4608258.1 D-tyrosyl-tRNA(Tyr) deacylase [Pleurotus pulmonarius]